MTFLLSPEFWIRLLEAVVVRLVFVDIISVLLPLASLALVPCDGAENALRRSVITSQGSLAIRVTRPIAGAITAVALAFFFLRW